MTIGLLALLTSLCAEPSRDIAARIPIVISTDIGVEVDDQWALVHLALASEVDLRGVVTTHSPSAPGFGAEDSAKLARTWLDRLPHGSRVPVVIGAAQPIRVDQPPRDGAGVRFLLDQSRGHDAANRLVVVMLGSATDVAEAVRFDPTWVDRVRVVAMGFNEWNVGGDVWNVKADPDAWRTLLDSRIPLVVGDSAVTRTSLSMTRQRATALLGGLPPPAADLRDDLDQWLAKNAELARREAGTPSAWPIWDEVTTAVLLGLATVEDRPRPRLGLNLRLEHPPTEARVGWVTAIDADRLWADLARRIRETRTGD